MEYCQCLSGITNVSLDMLDQFEANNYTLLEPSGVSEGLSGVSGVGGCLE